MKSTVAIPAGHAWPVTWTLVPARKDWSPDADSVAVGPSSSAPRTWLRRGRDGHVPVDGDQVLASGATRKICSGTATTAGGWGGTVVGRCRVEQVEGHVRLGDGASGPRPVGMPQAAVPSATTSTARSPASGPDGPARLTPHPPSAVVLGQKGQLDDELGPAPGGILDPDRAAVEADVLGHQRQPEAGALARRPAGRPGCPGRSARRGGSRSCSGIPGPWSSTTTRMHRRPGRSSVGAARLTLDAPG